MKVFWWQRGLHAEPERAEERKALVLLFDSCGDRAFQNTHCGSQCHCFDSSFRLIAFRLRNQPTQKSVTKLL